MTTQDYINEEIRKDLDARSRALAQSQQAQVEYGRLCQQQAQSRDYGQMPPSEVILLRAKVRELMDQLAGERERCRDIVQDAIREMEDSDAVAGPLTSPRTMAEMIIRKIRGGE